MLLKTTIQFLEMDSNEMEIGDERIGGINPNINMTFSMLMK